MGNAALIHGTHIIHPLAWKNHRYFVKLPSTFTPISAELHDELPGYRPRGSAQLDVSAARGGVKRARVTAEYHLSRQSTCAGPARRVPTILRGRTGRRPGCARESESEKSRARTNGEGQRLSAAPPGNCVKDVR